MTGYDKLTKEELIGMLEARDQRDKVGSTGSAAYRLRTSDPQFNGEVKGIFFQHGIALKEVDLEAEAALLEKIETARALGDPGKKELNQLENEWGETVTHKVRQMKSDFGIEYEEVNFPGGRAAEPPADPEGAEDSE